MFGVRVLSRQKLYRVDKIQETYAVGLTLLFSGFFPVYSANNGLGASMLLHRSGATTQVWLPSSSHICCLGCFRRIRYYHPGHSSDVRKFVFNIAHGSTI